MEESQSQSQPQPPPPPSSRFKIWTMYLTFSLVVLIAISSTEAQEDKKAIKGWGIALSVLSLLLSFATSFLHIHDVYRAIVPNSIIELSIILVLVFLWTILVILVSSPTNGLAVYDDGAIDAGNMYYFSWAGFITGIVLLASYVESVYGISVASSFRNNRQRYNNADGTPYTHDAITNGNANATWESYVEPNTAATDGSNTDGTGTGNNVRTPSMAFIYWASLLASSIIVMATSSDIFGKTCNYGKLNNQPYCSQTAFAITTGVMASISALLILISKLLYFTIPFILESLLVAILFVLYIFELMLVTRSDGPGSALGNLYYFSWISFMLIFGIGKCCYEDYVAVLQDAEREFEERRRTTNVPSFEMRDLDEEGGDHEIGTGRTGRGEQYTSVANNERSIPSPIAATAETPMDGRKTTYDDDEDI